MGVRKTAPPAYFNQRWSNARRAPGMFSNVPLKSDDEILFVTGNGAGYGNPFERDPAFIQADVLGELLSVEQARIHFGVVICEKSFEIDLTATAKLRAEGAMI